MVERYGGKYGGKRMVEKIKIPPFFLLGALIVRGSKKTKIWGPHFSTPTILTPPLFPSY
jgi:hypothetical protein